MDENEGKLSVSLGMLSVRFLLLKCISYLFGEENSVGEPEKKKKSCSLFQWWLLEISLLQDLVVFQCNTQRMSSVSSIINFSVSPQ